MQRSSRVGRSGRRMAAKKEEYVLPSLNARMLVDLMN